MADWTYSAHKLLPDGTSTLLDPDLPLQGVELTHTVSGTDSLRARISPAIRRLVGLDGRPVIRAWSTAIMATDPGGQIRVGAIVSSVPRSPDTESIQIEGVGFTGAIDGQPYAAQQFFVQADPLDIVRHIWDHWQAQPLGNLGMVIDRTSKTTHKIGTVLKQVEFDTVNGPVAFEAGPYKLLDYETNDLGGEMKKLSQDYDFDYRESHAWNADGTLSHRLDFGVPRIGTRRDNLRFVVGENVTVNPDIQPGEYASAVLVRGAGDGPTTLRRWGVRASEDRIRRIRVIDDDKLKKDSDLIARGQWALPLLAGRPEITDIVVRDHDNARIGSWSEGDEIEVHTDDEWGNETIPVRILSTTYSPEDLGVARLSVARADTLTA